MPYTTMLMKTAARDTVFKRFSWAIENMLTDVAGLVAETFRRSTGEHLVAPRDSIAYPPIVSSTLPVDLVLMIAAYWTEERADHFEAIQQEIERVVLEWFDGHVTVEVHLNQINRPKPSPELLARPIRKLLAGMGQTSSKTINMLTRAGYQTVGELIQLSEADLDAIWGIGAHSVALVKFRLKQKGLALRQAE